MLKIDVQASAITNLTDARYFAAREAQYLCFDLSDPSVEPHLVAAIKEWVDGVEIVGAFTAEKVADIHTMANDLSLDVIQLGAFYTLEEIADLEIYPLAKQIIIETDTNWSSYEKMLVDFAPKVHHFILDFQKSGIAWSTLSLPQIDQLRTWCKKYPLILDLPFQLEDLPQIIQLAPYGIDLKGGEEEKVGFKSFDELDDILDILTIEK